ncbi:MAG: HAD-IIB family hydrolase, partial [bacterium]|nr:HAD-IIB family hydrolase [bacterium]
MGYQMIVLDLDGTLTNSEKCITPKTKEVLMKIQEQGKKIVLASGRPTYGVMPLAKELELEKYGGFILSFNGGTIINCKTMETVFARTLPVESNQKIISLAEQYGVNLLTYDGDFILTPKADCPYVKKEAAINKLDVEQVTNFKECVQFPVVKFLLLDDGDYLATVEPRVKAALGRDFSVYRSEPYFLEVLPKGIDKAKSLERLLQVMGLRREEM